MVTAAALAEQRVILNNISWQTFTAILKELGEKRAARLAYNQGTLEIMTPLGEHENTNRFIDDLIRILADELNLNLKKFGSLTLKRDDMQRGVEPDSCYYIQNESLARGKRDIDLNFDPPPDLVIEIDITSTSLDKRPIYANLGVPEFLLYDGRTLKFFVLSEPILIYTLVQQSPTFPLLMLDVIPRFIEQSLTEGETLTLRSFRTWVSQRLKY
ncbi:MAG: Uma2 family endonuclease [Mojavia pulchra JT2-VF2]|jgi:Uma2 family endonuclease|uniref:Uma2 family endonuclease n=1 Tax=Mojavia pulchra JT2-VF2 TaxID=287848 RepID=A0A951PZN9_9NOST|nr:Uma2 family endonuclease [Mojavia pulchra JT2-VF2]